MSQPYDYYIVLDLEGKVEILEFPVALINSKTLKVVDKMHHYVHPTVMKIEFVNSYIQKKQILRQCVAARIEYPSYFMDKY